MKLHGKSILAGRLGDAHGPPFHAFDPAAGAPIETPFHEASPAEADEAVAAAAAAFPRYRALPAAERAAFLEKIAAEIEALGDGLLERAQAETGLPLARLTGERARTCGQLRLFAAVVREGSWVDARIDTALPDRQPLPRPDLRRMLIPLGPVVVFGSSNFPLAFSVAGGDTASALAAGCPVIVKAHRAHPGTSELVAAALERARVAAGLPAGVFSLVHGGGATIGLRLVKHPAVTAVGFTGSRAAGKSLADAAAARPHPIPVFAEMSSLNPVFLLPGALAERGPAIANGLVGSLTLGVGQFCTKPGLVFVRGDKSTDSFLAALTTAVAGAACGTMLTPGIRDAFEENQSQITSVPGVTVLATADVTADATCTQGRPTVAVTSGSTFLREPLLATEAFGPFTLVVQVDDEAQMLACARALEGQLTATLHATDADLAAAGELLTTLEQKAGRLLLNGYPTGVEVSPAMHHGGPAPATNDARFTSVGTAALLRFARPVCYQNFPPALLPISLQNDNPENIMRLVNNDLTRQSIG